MKKLLSILVLSTILVSCGTSNNVVNNGLFQKRKHTSGWFVKKNKGIQKKSANEENLAFEEIDKKEDSSKKGTLAISSDETPKTIQKTEERKESTITKARKKNKTVKKQSFANERSDFTAQSSIGNASNKAITKFGTEKEDFKIESNRQDKNNSSSSDVPLILLVILCFLLPPLAVWLASRDTTQLIISIILTILFILPGVIYALLVVFGVI